MGGFMKRRSFLSTTTSLVATSMLPQTLLSFAPDDVHQSKFSFGVVADVHKDLMPDADQRLEKFVDEAMRREVDFLIQLGDFCMGDARNKDFMKIWEQYRGPKHHVLGNHDMDINNKQQMLDYWGMPSTYYSWNFQGVHFVVLDANFLYQDGTFTDYERANFYVDDQYRTFIDPVQIEWLEADLNATKLPTVIFSHQSLWHYQWGVKNRLAIQKILEAHQDKVICCMNGHNHIDFHYHQNGIDYIEINSLSYQWMEDKYRSAQRFAPEFYEQYKSLPNIAPYQDPLYAFVTFDPQGTLIIEGVKSDWVSPSPYDLGMPPGVYGSKFSAEAEMSDYNLKF